MSIDGLNKKKEALLYTIAGRIIQIIVGLGTLKVQTAYLAKEQMGEYGLFLNIATLIVFVSFRPLNQYFNRRLHGWFASGVLTKGLIRIIGVLLLFGVFSVPAIFLGAQVISVNSNSPIFVWALTWAAWYFFSSIFNTVVPAFNLLGDKRRWVVHNSLGLALCLLIAWLAVRIRPDALSWTLGLTLGFFLSSSAATMSLLRASQGTHRESGPEIIIPLDFLIPATVAVGGIWIQFQAFRLFAVDFMPLGEYGLFTAGYGLAAGVMAAYEGLAAQYLLPFFYAGLNPSAGETSQNKQWSILAGTMMVLTAATCLIAIGFGPLMCRLLLADAFRNAWPYFFIGIIMEGARIVSGTTALGTHITMQVHRSLRSYIVGLLSLALGIFAGKTLGGFTTFTAIVMAGCFGHLAVLSWDVSRHLNAGLALPPVRYLLGLFVAVTAFVISLAMNIGLVAQGGLLAAASVFYILLMLDINAEFELAN